MVEIVISKLHEEDILTGIIINESMIETWVKEIEALTKRNFEGITFAEAMESNSFMNN